MCGTRKMMKATPMRRMMVVGRQVLISSFHFTLPVRQCCDKDGDVGEGGDLCLGDAALEAIFAF